MMRGLLLARALGQDELQYKYREDRRLAEVALGLERGTETSAQQAG